MYYKLDFSYLNQNIALSITDQKEFFYVKVKKIMNASSSYNSKNYKLFI